MPARNDGCDHHQHKLYRLKTVPFTNFKAYVFRKDDDLCIHTLPDLLLGIKSDILLQFWNKKFQVIKLGECEKNFYGTLYKIPHQVTKITNCMQKLDLESTANLQHYPLLRYCKSYNEFCPIVPFQFKFAF